VPAFERRAVPNPNANTANAMTKHFFPIIEEFLLLFPRFNPTMTTKLPSNVRKDEMKGKKEKQTTRNAVAIAEIGSYFLSKTGRYAL
jgi:hypothetical protein